MNFEQHALLLIDVDGTNAEWLRPSSVFSGTPTWCKFTHRYPNAESHDGVALPTSFRELLDIQLWEPKKNLLSELEPFAFRSPNCFTGVEAWNSNCKYVFQALTCIKASDMTKVRLSWSYDVTLPSWIVSIMGLEIYPVTR